MTKHDSDEQEQLPARFVDYDPRNPSPRFTEEQIRFIESISDHLTAVEFNKIRDLEWFRLDLETGDVNFEIIPGLRDVSSTGCMYLKRYSDTPYKIMIAEALKSPPSEFSPRALFNHYEPPFRVMTPEQDRYYPIEFRGDLGRWRERLKQIASDRKTLLGEFDRGRFVLADGRSFGFSALKVDRAEGRTYPKDW